MTLLEQFDQRVESVNEFNSKPCYREYALQAAKSFKAELEAFATRLTEDERKRMALSTEAQMHDVNTGEKPYYLVYLVNGDEEAFKAKFYYYHDEESMAAKAKAEKESIEAWKKLGFEFHPVEVSEICY